MAYAEPLAHANSYLAWADKILTLSVRNKDFYLNGQTSNSNLDELKELLSKNLIETNTHIAHSRFKVALKRLYSIYKYNNNPGDSDVHCVPYPIEIWFLIFKARNEINSLAGLINYVRTLTHTERLNLILTIYNFKNKQGKPGDHVKQLNKSTKMCGFHNKVMLSAKVNIRNGKIKNKKLKICKLKVPPILEEGITNTNINSGKMKKFKISIWSFNRNLRKISIMKADLIIECIIFLCELGRGFDDFPIISYNNITIDKIPVSRKSIFLLSRIRLTIVQYENCDLNFYFKDNLTFVSSIKKISRNRIKKMIQLENLIWLEMYKQCFKIKQNYVHKEINPIISCINLFKDSNFYCIYKSYALDNNNLLFFDKSLHSSIKCIRNISTCCAAKQNIKSANLNNIPFMKTNMQKTNLSSIFSDLFYLIDLLFENLQGNNKFPCINTAIPSLNTILEWTFILVLCTIPDSTLLRNIIIRLALFGIDVSPLDKLKGDASEIISDTFRFGFNSKELDICDLKAHLLTFNNYINTSDNLSNLEYLLTDCGDLNNNNNNKNEDIIINKGTKIKCLDKIIKFIVQNLKIGYAMDLSDYNRVKQLIDNELLGNFLVTSDILICLSLAEMIIARYNLSFNYAKLVLCKNEFNKNCWRIIFTLSRINNRHCDRYAIKIDNKQKHIFKGNRIRLHKMQHSIIPYKHYCDHHIDLKQLPMEILSIRLMKTFNLALKLENKLLNEEWWFQWEQHIIKRIKCNDSAENITYNVILDSEFVHLGNRYDTKARVDGDSGLVRLLQNLYKNDTKGINGSLWVLKNMTFPLSENDKFYEYFIVLWALSNAGYARTVIDLIGFNVKNDPHSAYLMLYSQFCLTKSPFYCKLVKKVRDISNEYPCFHKITRLRARFLLASGELAKANKLFSKARKNYFLNMNPEQCSERILPTFVDNVCNNYSITIVDSMCEEYCRRCIKASKLIF